MIKQMKYFQAVARLKSFTKAADECFISQSAISQQIQALEKELGVKLIQREGRKFTLTEAGEYFYRKSLVIVNDFERLRAETMRLAEGAKKELSIGFLRHYNGQELKTVLPEFQSRRPEIELNLISGTHEELYGWLRSGRIDVVISDLRRAPSDEYVNFYLTRGYLYAEIPAKSPLASLQSITMEDLKNTPAILVATAESFADEEMFFREYYAFWRADTLKEYVEPFAAMLKEQFPKEAKGADFGDKREKTALRRGGKNNE